MANLASQADASVISEWPTNLPESVISGQKRVWFPCKPLRQTGASPCSRLVCIEMVHGNPALYNHSVRNAKRKFRLKVHVGICLALQGGHK
jgi:hypothetical protein